MNTALSVRAALSELPLHPAPREVTALGGTRSSLPARWRCAPGEAARVRAFLEAAGLAASVAPDACVPALALASEGAGAPPEAAGLPAGGYRLRVGADGVTLRGADDAGFFAGLQSLWQLLRTREPVPCAEVSDWPAVKVRAFQVDLGRQGESLAELKRLVRQQAPFHYNQVQLYLENTLKLEAFGDAADPDGLTPAEFRELDAFAGALGLEVVPSLNLLGHMEKLLRHPRLAPLSEMAHGARHPEQAYAGCVCPELPAARALVAAIVAEVCALARSPNLMVGLDECWTLGSHPLTRARLDAGGGAGAVFRDWIRFLHGEVTRHGKRMWMWEDMLFYHTGALEGIPADIGMNEWHYQHIEAVPHYSFRNWGRIDALRELAGRGHPVMLCTGPAPQHLHSMLRYAAGAPLEGVLVVQWEGRGIVQELHHLDRALAAGVLWTGRALPDTAAAVRAVGGVGAADAVALAPVLGALAVRPGVKGGGTHGCPRFWSWPENAALRELLGGLLPALGRSAAAGSAPFDVMRLFLEAEWARVTADWARESAALVGRQVLRAGGTGDPLLAEAVDAAAAAAAVAVALAPAAEAIQARYTAGVAPRPMAANFARAAEELRDLHQRLARFAAAPGPGTWPFAAVSVHVDGLVLDACAHRVVLRARRAGGAWLPVHDGGARLPPSLEGEFVMSFPLPWEPAEVELAVGGFAAFAVQRVRVETLAGTRLPVRVAACEGAVWRPEHLLDYDRKVAIFNAPDVLSEWRRLTPPVRNAVTLGF